MTSTKKSASRQSAALLFCAAIVAPGIVAASTSGANAKVHEHHRRVVRHYAPAEAYRYYPRYGYRDYSGYMDPHSGHYDLQFQRNRENFGFSGRDPSRIGGEDPNLHPPGSF
jgi:hypothetical protein